MKCHYYLFCNEIRHVLQHMQPKRTTFTEKPFTPGYPRVFPLEEKLSLFTQLSNASKTVLG